MDIKIALGKIEQYWQIIRNLHFHIEQEGQISPEEYALIEKYLKVITQKYKDLVVDVENYPVVIAEQDVLLLKPENIVEENQQKIVEPAEEKISAPIQEEKSSIVAVEEKEVSAEMVPSVEIEEEQIIVEEIVTSIVEESISENVEEEKVEQLEEEFIPELKSEKEENLSTQIEELIPDIAASQPKHHKISSYLEQMLDSNEEVPNTPMFFNVKQENAKATSLNDKLKEMRSPVEDLNSRIKRATADKISLNDKFEFIKDLFGNNPIEYASAIQQFDTYGSMIWGNVEREFSTKFNWASKPATVQKLKTLVTGK